MHPRQTIITEWKVNLEAGLHNIVSIVGRGKLSLDGLAASRTGGQSFKQAFVSNGVAKAGMIIVVSRGCAGHWSSFHLISKGYIEASMDTDLPAKLTAIE
jgi:hypothetical protein